MNALHYEAMNNTKYEDMDENYNNVCIMNKMKFLCEGVDSHINTFYSSFHTHKAFYMIRKQSGETVTNYFDCFKLVRFNAELSK